MRKLGIWLRSTTVITGTLTVLATSGTLVSADAPASTAPGWTSSQPAPGVELRSGTLGKPSPDQHWTVTIRIAPGGGSGNPDPDAPATELGNQQDADATAKKLSAAGFRPRSEQVDWPSLADTPRGPLGWRVRVGDFTTADQAKSEAARITAAGFRAAADWTGYDGGPSGGPWQVHVAIIDPHQFSGHVAATYGQAVSGREKTSAMSASAGATVGVNAGFFVMEDKDGIPGEPAGVGVYDGHLQSEATHGRVGLVLGQDQHPRIDAVSTRMSVRSGADTREINGVNRKPGVIRNCGEPGAVPTEHPLHDVTCTSADDLVAFTPQLGGATPAGDGVEAVLDAQNKVIALHPRGATVPAGGHVLQGIGSGARWLTDHAQPGTVMQLDNHAEDSSGKRLPAHSDVVNGGPWLVRDGQNYVDATADGIVHPNDPSFFYGWALRRNPRTMAGIDREGRLLLVTVDGRQPGRSAGFSLTEASDFMRSLGATNAMNLDGGGSTTFAVNGAVANSPSDATGERPVGDAVVVVPRR